jgi:Ca2+/Na+ antiporter
MLTFIDSFIISPIGASILVSVIIIFYIILNKISIYLLLILIAICVGYIVYLANNNCKNKYND